MMDGGATYSIKAVAQATGLSVETLRAWERRYGVVEPRRDGGGHRVYTASDVERLRKLHQTTQLGHPIGKVAKLSDAEIERLLSQRSIRPSAAGPTQHGAAQALIDRIIGSIERYQPDDCDQAIAMAFALLPVADVIREVLSPALREVGDRWHRGVFSIAQERMVSSSIRRQVSGLLNTYNNVAKGAGVVFATVSGEQHELGILLFAALGASLGLRTFYLGPDLPAQEIADYARRVKAAAVAVSLVMPENLDDVRAQLATLRRHLPADVEIWLGGAASDCVDANDLPAGSLHMTDCDEFATRVRLLTA